MAKFRKKPVVVEAICNGGEWAPIRDWLVGFSGGGVAFPVLSAPPITRNRDGSLNIHTLEGTMRAEVGDWVIRGVRGEFYPCKPDIFSETYEPGDEDPWGVCS